MIALATIGLCLLTQAVADLCGIALSEQANVGIVRQWFRHGFDSWRNFLGLVWVVVQIVVVMPVLEECVFRLPTRWLRARGWWILSSVLFSAAHYLQQPFPDNALVALFFFGLAQCWLYRKTQRLWCAMLNHALFNMTNLALLPFVD